MRRITLSLFMLASFFITSCERREPALRKADSIIVGRVADPLSPSDSVIYYRIDTDLWVDSAVTNIDAYYDIRFNTVLPDSLYRRVMPLLSMVPGEIMPRHNQHIGHSTAEGYLDVIVYTNGHPHRFYFEEDQSACSAIIQRFVQAINSEL